MSSNPRSKVLTMRLRVLSLSLAGVLASALPGLAIADIVWDFTSAGACSPSCSALGASRTYTGSDGSTVKATAWSNTGGNDTTSSQGTATPTNVGTLQAAYLGSYSSGLGVGNTEIATNQDNREPADQPEHAMDNDQRYDSILLSFTQKVTLNAVNIGYANGSSTGDADISVFAYIGNSGNPPSVQPTLTSSTYDALSTSALWKKTSFPGTGPNAITTPGAGSAQYFLVAAYVPQTGVSDGTNLGAGGDYLKVSGVTASKAVPEPNALLLVGLVMAGLWSTRRAKVA